MRSENGKECKEWEEGDVVVVSSSFASNF